MNRLLIILPVLLFVVSCSIFPKGHLDKDYPFETSPYFIYIDSNLYMAKTEVTNYKWLEYVYWMVENYPDKRVEFKMDTPNWFYQFKTNDYSNFYNNHPHYLNYPVANITFEQAKQFSKWQSDRIYESILLAEGFLDISSSEELSTPFTIEGFLNGEFQNLIPDSTFPPILVFDLPTLEHYKLALALNERIDQNQKDKFRLRKYKGASPSDSSLFLGALKKDSITEVAFYNVIYTSNLYPNSSIYNLKGNVSELTSDSTLIFGGNWYHTEEHHSNTGTFHHGQPSNFIGFRNVYRYVPIPELKKELGIE